MPREVEAKIILDSCTELDIIREKLEKLGFRKECEVLEKDVYFQHPCRDFAKTDEALRVRFVEGHERLAEVTYKGPKQSRELKIREEINVRVENGEDMVKLLEKLGFKVVAVVEKRRSYYLGQGVKITLDHVRDLGCFVEVEAVEGGVEAVKRVLRLLGLEDKRSTVKSYLELLLERRGTTVNSAKEGLRS